MIQELKSEYYNGINSPEVNISGYSCDRCKVQPLSEREYVDNWMINGYRYCDECRYFMKIQRFKCIYCTKSWSNRAERLLPLECECGGLVCLLK